MILYASQTHGKRNLKALRKNGFSLLVTPDTWERGGHRPPLWDDGTPAPFALDNGAFGCFQRGEPFNWAKFNALVGALGDAAAWVVAPDIVAGGLESLRMSVKWREDWDSCPVLLAVQDGMAPEDVAPFLDETTGVAVGGSTEFKIKTLPIWARLAARSNCYLHVLRVNTRRRLAACSLAGAHSVDGTSATIYSVNAPKLKRWTDELNNQQTLGFWK